MPAFFFNGSGPKIEVTHDSEHFRNDLVSTAASQQPQQQKKNV
jgi:hypothetical protein